MSDAFRPISAEQLTRWVFTELEGCDSIFGIPRRHFFTPSAHDPFRTSVFGHALDTPFGPAAGPHSQMAQNIVAAWLCGARYIELKTVQTLDELEVSKPCIDMEDEGYNVEWSQELKVHQSFEEYLRAWVLIHALHRRLGFHGESPGVVFNLSVGYDLEGIKKPNIQWFLDRMADCSGQKQAMVDQVARFFPGVRQLEIPDRLSDNVTISTMHGCPPGEIGDICRYLLRERGLHTYVKCNPTLLGPDKVRQILNESLGYTDIVVPDEAFEHDLHWQDAVPLLENLLGFARGRGLGFGIKLSNTLEVENFRKVFDASEKMMYLSGRPLFAITTNLALQLSEEFRGELPISFSAGADCFNAPDLLAAGMQTVTVCTDLLKTGGYPRLLQYTELARERFEAAGASSIGEFIARPAGPSGPSESALSNLRSLARECCNDPRLKKDAYLTSHSKTTRDLGLFDCIKAPCTDACAIDQEVPLYMDAVRRDELPAARCLVRKDNPIPVLLARACDHLCEPACVRSHLDEPLAIRHVKRYIMEHEPEAETRAPGDSPGRVAIIGAGPAGLAAASELARAGVEVEIYEQHDHAGGMVGGVIPEYRMPRGVIGQDLEVLERLGVVFHFGQAAGKDFTLSGLREGGFESIVIAVGAQLGKSLGLEGEDCEGVIDALQFLRRSRDSHPPVIGPRIGIIGAGDTAMDCARTAWRRAGDDVSIIYRRSLEQMPADREEIRCLLEEGITITEMAKPHRLLVGDGKLRGLLCRRMEYRGDRDDSGRKVPHEIPGEEFEVPLDTLILAISQHALLDLFGDEEVDLTERGFIDVDPDTHETSLPGVYAGGDVAGNGPSSIVEAAADGKAIARSILGRTGEGAGPDGVESMDTAELLRRRSRRQWRVPVPHTLPGQRRNFDEVVLGYTRDQARAEASRCLDCDRYCSLCAGVCPNLAIQTFRTDSIDVQLPELRIENGRLLSRPGAQFSLRQAFQVAVLADLCNECGNCTTFCPTAGRPYRDKARFYLDRAEFEAQDSNAFMIVRENNHRAMESRWNGETHRIKLDGRLHYEGAGIRARIDPRDFAIEDLQLADAGAPAGDMSLLPCATMYVLLAGLAQSMPHWPVMRHSAKENAPPESPAEGNA